MNNDILETVFKLMGNKFSSHTFYKTLKTIDKNNDDYPSYVIVKFLKNHCKQVSRYIWKKQLPNDTIVKNLKNGIENDVENAITYNLTDEICINFLKANNYSIFKKVEM